MTFQETSIAGAYLIGIDPFCDERGFFARTWCREEFAARGLNGKIAQCSISFNLRRGTLRGMHYQEAPYAEAKVVRCTAGAIYDVLIDIRPNSPTFQKWFAAELSSSNRAALFVPEGVAHGFQTLADSSEVEYQISEPYQAGYGRGVRWNDPAFGVQWPLEISVISERDRGYPDFPAA
jgi:dTDP-4-dehydrorhamnose 3,5-epimerase